MATILIVDDDAPSRMLLTTLLEHAGHRVRTARGGAEALETLAAGVPDLLVTDLSMAELSGAELVRRLRKRPEYRDLKIALYTASSASPALADFMDIYGICALLPKPGEPEEIVARVSAALSS